MSKFFKNILLLVLILSFILVLFYSIEINETIKPIILKVDQNIDRFISKNFDSNEFSGQVNENVETTTELKTTTERDKVNEQEEEKKIREFYNTLASKERKIYSQNREDGVVEAIFDLLNIPDLKKTFVEIGTESGVQCNTRYFREQKGWTGIMFDGLYGNLSINLHTEIIHHKSVLQLFEKYKIEDDMDLLSEDTDYADYWIVEAILTKYKPKVLIHEVNQQPPEKCVVAPKSDELIYWDFSNYHGGSVCAFHCLAKTFKYSMVYCESAGVNCFWIRNDIIEKYLKFNPSLVQKVLNPNLLFKMPGFVYKETGKTWHQISC